MSTEVTQHLGSLQSLRIAHPEPPVRAVRRLWISMALAVLLLGAAGLFSFRWSWRPLGRPPAIQTMTVQATTAAEPQVLLTGSGYVVTRHKYITIGTKILGQIVAEPIEEGQHVKMGDLLARIDDRDYQAQLRQALAARDLAEANVRLSSAKADRARNLVETGAISRDDYDTAINALEVAQAQLKRDEAAVDYAKFEVGQCVITSPIHGIVLKKYRELGDTINYGGQIQAGGGATDIAQLADTNDMRAEVDINESEIAKIAIGSLASVVLDAYPDRRFESRLVKVYPEADRQKGTVKVEVQIRNPDLDLLRPEMGVKVSFMSKPPTVAAQPAIVIPKAAIKEDGNVSYVWTVQNGVLRKTPIVWSRNLETGVEVRERLKQGDIVSLVQGIHFHEGERVLVARPAPDVN